MRYFFDVFDSAGKIADDEGAVFASFDAMRQGAKRVLAQLAADEPLIADSLAISVRVRDAEGHTVYNICLSIKGKDLPQ